MPVEFSEHAKLQLKERGISMKAVLAVIAKPQKILSSYRGRKLRQGIIGDKILEVVTKTEGTKITVVTAYSLED